MSPISSQDTPSQMQKVARLLEVLRGLQPGCPQSQPSSPTYLGPGDGVGHLRVPGCGAGQGHILSTSHCHLPHPRSQVAGCKRKPESQPEKKWVSPGSGGPAAAAAPEAARHGWALQACRAGCNPLVAEHPGTSPEADPGEPPEDVGEPSRAGQERGAPFPPRHPAPPPGRPASNCWPQILLLLLFLLLLLLLPRSRSRPRPPTKDAVAWDVPQGTPRALQKLPGPLASSTRDPQTRRLEKQRPASSSPFREEKPDPEKLSNFPKGSATSRPLGCDPQF